MDTDEKPAKRLKTNEADERLLSENEKEMKMKKLTFETAMLLRNLDDRVHDENTVKTLIEGCPTALKYHDDEYPLVAVQHLLANSSCGYSFAPLLVAEGIRLEVFSKKEKGGLDSQHRPRSANILGVMEDFLSSDGSEMLRKRLGIDEDEFDERNSIENDVEFHVLLKEMNNTHDEETTKVLRELFENHILDKKDILDHGLIFHAAQHHSRTRFEFLVHFCPESLSKPSLLGYVLIQKICAAFGYGGEDGFEMLLKAGLEHYPKKLGFLFRRFPIGKRERTIEAALSSDRLNLTQNDIFGFIQEAIPTENNHPILHDVIRLAPKYSSLVWNYYPDAVYLRDRKGRLPIHIALERAGKWSHPLLSLIAINDPIDRHEKDPVTGLYTFMSAASGRVNDLSVIYYLLRRDPNAWEGFRELPPTFRWK